MAKRIRYRLKEAGLYEKKVSGGKLQNYTPGAVVSGPEGEFTGANVEVIGEVEHREPPARTTKKKSQ